MAGYACAHAGTCVPSTSYPPRPHTGTQKSLTIKPGPRLPCVVVRKSGTMCSTRMMSDSSTTPYTGAPREFAKYRWWHPHCCNSRMRPSPRVNQRTNASWRPSPAWSCVKNRSCSCAKQQLRCSVGKPCVSQMLSDAYLMRISDDLRCVSQMQAARSGVVLLRTQL